MNNCVKKEKKDEARALVEEMQNHLEDRTTGIWQVRQAHADVRRGLWATTLHHGQKMADVAEQ